MDGISLPDIAAVLGHKILAVTSCYAHLSPEHAAGVSCRLGNLVPSGE